MTGIIVTGHGSFPTGILSAVSLVAGKPEQVTAVDFMEGMSSAELKEALNQAADALEGNEIMILADLVGGTPFNMATMLKGERTDKSIRVIAGINMPGLVEAVFSRPMYTAEQLAAAVGNAARAGVSDLDALAAEDDGEPEFEDGL